MTIPGKIPTISLVALALATAGLCLTAYTIDQASESARINASRQATLRELVALQSRADQSRAALRLLETIQSAPADITAAAQKILPASKLVMDPPKETSLANGWLLREIVVTLEDTPPGDAGRLVEYLENQRPPWRLTACEFKPSMTGRAATKLTLQTIVRESKPGS